jgi:galactose mutarotase-like enzyme
MELRLAARTLEITVTVENRDEETMPWSFGLHPYFGIADLATARVEGLPVRAVDQLTGQACASGQQLDLLAEGIDLLAGPVQAVRLLDPTAGTAVELEATPPLDLAVIWSDPPRPMVCLEPWTAPRAALISGDRRLDLAPGTSNRLHCRFRALA